MVTVDYSVLFQARTWHLELERESDKFWVVVDRENLYGGEPAVMMRADRALCERFIHAFCERTPGATSDALHSWRVAQMVRDERSNVLPFVRMHEQLDESA